MIKEGLADWFADNADASVDVPFGDLTTVLGQPMMIVPYQIDNHEMKMWTDPAVSPDSWLDYARRNFDQLCREGEEGNSKTMSLGLHLRIIGRAGRIWALEEFFRHVRAHSDVWIATREEIAAHFARVEPA